jgi:hypothetical protein
MEIGSKPRVESIKYSKLIANGSTEEYQDRFVIFSQK